MDAAHHFKAFEYMEEFYVAVLGENLLEELGSFLHMHQLGDIIGLSMLSNGEEQWVKTVFAR